MATDVEWSTLGCRLEGWSTRAVLVLCPSRRDGCCFRDQIANSSSQLLDVTGLNIEKGGQAKLRSKVAAVPDAGWKERAPDAMRRHSGSLLSCAAACRQGAIKVVWIDPPERPARARPGSVSGVSASPEFGTY